MPDPKRPDDKKAAPKPATPPDDDAELELSDEKLDKVAGGLAKQRFDKARVSPYTNPP